MTVLGVEKTQAFDLSPGRRAVWSESCTRGLAPLDCGLLSCLSAPCLQFCGLCFPLPNLWPAPHPGTQFRRESEKTVVRIFVSVVCWLSFIVIKQYDEKQELRALPRDFFWAGSPYMPSWAGQGSLFGVPPWCSFYAFPPSPVWEGRSFPVLLLPSLWSVPDLSL